MTYDPMTRSCGGCKFAVMQDHGWSNYSAEGAEFFCSKQVHPEDGFDSFYSASPRLAFAADCTLFEAGFPINMDVDGEAAADLNDEQRAIYDGGPPY